MAVYRSSGGADAVPRLLSNTNATTGAEAHADFGALRSAESAAPPRYYRHGTARGWEGDRTDLVAEVLPASRFEFVREATAIPQEDLAITSDVADLGDLHSGD